MGTVVLSHGLHSGPGAAKIRYLGRAAREAGWSTLAVDCEGVMDPGVRVRRLLDQASAVDGPLVLAGSSLGGWVSAAASASLHPRALFLVAPAFDMPGLPEAAPAPRARRVVIIHGWGDDVVPVDNALRYARDHRAELHLLDDGHRLSESLPLLGVLLADLLGRLAR